MKTKRIPKSFGQSSKSIKFCATYGGFIVYSGFAYAERQTRKIRMEHKSFRFCNRHNLHIRFTKYAFNPISMGGGAFHINFVCLLVTFLVLG